MRDSFIRALTGLLERDERTILLTADLGFGIFDDIAERFPDRFVNVGVAEQNMIGVGTGLALDGWTVFAYSLGNFPTIRCLEQIRNDAAYHEANVNIVSSGGGFTYGGLGMSHHATEDLSLMRALPGVTVIAPADAFEAEQATIAIAARPGVSYLRIEKNVPIDTKDSGSKFEIGKARQIKPGTDLTLIAAGGIVSQALKSSDDLEKHGISTRVISMHTLSPIDTQIIEDAARETGAIISIEENTVAGGLGGAVAEVLAESGISARFKRIGMLEIYSAIVGDQDYLRSHYNLDAEAITKTALSLIGKGNEPS